MQFPFNRVLQLPGTPFSGFCQRSGFFLKLIQSSLCLFFQFFFLIFKIFNKLQFPGNAVAVGENLSN